MTSGVYLRVTTNTIVTKQKDKVMFKQPKVFLLGKQAIHWEGMCDYLLYTGQYEFVEVINKARDEGLSDGEILCSFFAKICYMALTDKKNKNINKVRDIKSNLAAIIDSRHGSVLQHATLNFIVTDCSRVYTHEQVRHGVGTAYSQTSGRYVRSDELNMVFDPILDPIKDMCLEKMREDQWWYDKAVKSLGLNDIKDFDTKKQMTSALRRFMPNGQCNEIGMSCNLRSLRHMIAMRTAGGAEWEIRLIFNQIYQLSRNIVPTMFLDAGETIIRGIPAITFKSEKV